MSATNLTAERRDTTDASTDFAHTGPGTLAGRYLRRFWHPVYLARDLPIGWAKPLRILGEDYTLYRGEGGTPHIVAYRCAHRGTQLSTGWVEGECIRCFYHGWKYDGSGQCIEMPAEDPSFPPKVKIASYPCEEYLGFIWAYFGEAPSPPRPRFPEFEEAGILEQQMRSRACNYFQNVENSVDEVHVHFVHGDTYNPAGLHEMPIITAEETDYGLAYYATRPSGETRVSHFLMPHLVYVKGAPDEYGWKDRIYGRVPIDDAHHLQLYLGLVRVGGEAARQYEERQRRLAAAREGKPGPDEVGAAILAGKLRVTDVEPGMDRVNTQDEVALRGQGVIVDRAAERLGRSDAAVILLRKIWARELQALAEGWPLKEWQRPERLVPTVGL